MTTDVLEVLPDVRLRRFDPGTAAPELLDRLLGFYADAETVRMVDGPDAGPYSLDTLLRMYRYLRDHGELYLVERRVDRVWTPIGDATLSESMVPIVLEPGSRGQGVGRAVLTALIARARQLGWRCVRVSDIYDYNVSSLALFTSVRFQPGASTPHGRSYVLDLTAG